MRPPLVQKRQVISLGLRLKDSVTGPERVALAIEAHPSRGKDLRLGDPALGTFLAKSFRFCENVDLWRTLSSIPTLAFKVSLLEAELFDDMVIALLVPIIGDMEVRGYAVTMRDFGGAVDVVLSC